MTTDGCWVQFYQSNNYQDGTFRFDGPISVPKLDDYEFSSGKKIGDQIDSLKTGTQTWIEVFEDDNYEDKSLKFGPNSSISNLDEYGLGDNIDSFKLYNYETIAKFRVPFKLDTLALKVATHTVFGLVKLS